MMSLYISRSIIRIAKELYRETIKEEMGKKKMNNHNKRRYLGDCDPETPLCFEYLEKSRVKRRGVSCFIFRPAIPPQIIDDYFCVDGPASFKKIKSKKEKSKTVALIDDFQAQLLVGRHHHICEPKYVKIKKMNTAFATAPAELVEIEMLEIRQDKKPNIESNQIIIKDYFRNSIKMPEFTKNMKEEKNQLKKRQKNPKPKKNAIERIFCLPASAQQQGTNLFAEKELEGSDQGTQRARPSEANRVSEKKMNISEKEQNEPPRRKQSELIDFHFENGQQNESLLSDVYTSVRLNEDIITKFQAEIHRSSSISFNKKIFSDVHEF